MAIGKFIVRTTPTGIKFDLKASNGEVISTSEVYKSKASCMNGIASVRRNAAVAQVQNETTENFEKVKCPKFVVYTDKRGEFRFRLLATNGQIIATGGEGYTTVRACLGGVDSVRRNAPEAPVVEQAD